jgi:hypothetical protein
MDDFAEGRHLIEPRAQRFRITPVLGKEIDQIKHYVDALKDKFTEEDSRVIAEFRKQNDNLLGLYQFTQKWVDKYGIPKGVFPPERDMLREREYEEMGRIGRGRLKGKGLLDFFRRGATAVSDAVGKVKEFFSPNLSSYNNATNRALVAYGNKPVESLTIYRKPVPEIFSSVFNTVSFGKWNQLRRQYGFDTFFHLSLVAKVRDMNDLISIEKLDRISVSTNVPEPGDGLETLSIPLHGAQFTILEMLEKARAEVGDKTFFEYDGFRNNCQYFISYLLKALGLYGEKEKGFVFQDISKIVEGLPSYVTSFQRGVTDLSATLNKITGGRKRRGGAANEEQPAPARRLFNQEERILLLREVEYALRVLIHHRLEGAGQLDNFYKDADEFTDDELAGVHRHYVGVFIQYIQQDLDELVAAGVIQRDEEEYFNENNDRLDIPQLANLFERYNFAVFQLQNGPQEEEKEREEKHQDLETGQEEEEEETTQDSVSDSELDSEYKTYKGRGKSGGALPARQAAEIQAVARQRAEQLEVNDIFESMVNYFQRAIQNGFVDRDSEMEEVLGTIQTLIDEDNMPLDLMREAYGDFIVLMQEGLEAQGMQIGRGMSGGAYEPPGMMLPFSSSQGYHQYGFGINIPQKEFVEEHRHLVKLLNKSSIPALRREAHKQGKELKMRGGADIRIQPEPRILYPSPLNPRKLDIRDTMKPLRL